MHDNMEKIGAQSGAQKLRGLAQKFRVTIGFLMAPVLLIVARPTVKSLGAGLIIAIIGLLIRAWASGHLKKNQELAMTGPYAHTRNPLYLGTLILGAGAALASGVWWFVLFFIALYLLIYVPVMSAEAETVNKLFPVEYESYSRQVPLFWPRLTAYRQMQDADATLSSGDQYDNARRFDRSLYLRYREYRAALGCALVFALLTAKMVWLGN